MIDVVPSVIESVRKNGIILEDEKGTLSIQVAMYLLSNMNKEIKLAILFGLIGKEYPLSFYCNYCKGCGICANECPKKYIF